mmetsp:Transcript_130563/g.325765  ORF Transcript_130563/g.325765 Transcript_130563/m.325765 type:complete len:552 (-) Transcript_130563:403-2058(-)
MGGVCSVNGETFQSRYRLGDLLGKGSQGKVYSCLDRQSGCKCAVKVLDRSSKTAWATYRREVDLCRACDSSRNVIRVIDEFSDTSYCYVVMEKFSGHLRKGLKWVAKENGNGVVPGLSNSSMRHILHQSATAISHLHSLEIVHRDVKAQNFLIDRMDLRDENCVVVLSDFGLARRLEPGHVLSAQVGTRKYWPPELYEKKYWNVVDVFALGVLLYLASSGIYPYPDEEASRTRDIFAESAIPECLTEEAREFMRLTLEKDPNKRPCAADILNHCWLNNKGHEASELSTTRIEQDGETVTITSTGIGVQATDNMNPFGGKLGRALAVPLPVPSGDLVEISGGDLESVAEPSVVAELAAMAETPSRKRKDDEDDDSRSETACTEIEDDCPSVRASGIDMTPSTGTGSSPVGGFPSQSVSSSSTPMRRKAGASKSGGAVRFVGQPRPMRFDESGECVTFALADDDHDGSAIGAAAASGLHVLTDARYTSNLGTAIFSSIPDDAQLEQAQATGINLSFEGKQEIARSNDKPGEESDALEDCSVYWDDNYLWHFSS